MAPSKKRAKKVATSYPGKGSVASKSASSSKGKPIPKAARPAGSGLPARKATDGPAARVAAAPDAAASVSAPRKWPKGGPTKAEIRGYRTRLLEMRRALLSSSRDLASEALKGAGGDFSVDHMADHGSDNFEQDFNLKLLEGEAGQLEDVRDALLKAEGRHELPFGLCEACTDVPRNECPTCPWIPASRLDVLPHARLCVQTKQSEEKGGR